MTALVLLAMPPLHETVPFPHFTPYPHLNCFMAFCSQQIFSSLSAGWLAHQDGRSAGSAQRGQRAMPARL